MFHFFTTHIRTHLFRSLSMFLISGISMIVLVVLYFFYQNIVGALSHYNYSIVDERRFTLQSDTNFFTLFSRNSSGLPISLAQELESSPRLEKVQSFSLVELPVLAKFSLFSFGLETDIPVFSVTDTALSGSGIPVGISRSMVDFYNLQFAGSSAMFPKINESFLIGQSVRITFGASKIFPSLPVIATAIDANIVRIGDDFPGFGLVIPESIVRKKMQEIGYTLAPPYKIVAYMKDVRDRVIVEGQYRAYNPVFDVDAIAKFQEKVHFFRSVFFGISFFIVSILGIFFIFLLFSFFRERRDVFRVIYIFGLSGMRARLLTLAEPISLLIVGSMVGSLIAVLIIGFLVEWGTSELMSRGISYTLLPVSFPLIVTIYTLVCLLFASIIVLLEYAWRRKSLMR